jgi:hypothetical protein
VMQRARSPGRASMRRGWRCSARKCEGVRESQGCRIADTGHSMAAAGAT